MPSWVDALLKWLYGLLSRHRDKERNRAVEEHIRKKKQEADDIIGDMSVLDRDDVLDRLHQSAKDRRRRKHH